MRPGVRDSVSGKEVSLEAYENFQNPNIFEEKVFAEGLKKVSQRDYSKGLSIIANRFGFKKMFGLSQVDKSDSKKPK